MFRATALVLLISFYGFAFGMASAWGCLAVGHGGKSVEIAGEKTLILYDAKNQTQHFIRNVVWLTKAKDFGFLVPTPSRPELAEAPDSIFSTLELLTNPPPPVTPGAVQADRSLTPKSKSVEVLEKKKVAGFDASVLKATDAQALADWLKKNDYPSGEEMASWLTPYVSHGWIVTAFKISSEPGQNQFPTSAVRMSFKTDKPFFPYREPPHKGEAMYRLLRVFFIAEKKYRGLFAENPWKATIPHSAPIDANSKKSLLRELKLPQDPDIPNWYLTEFEDRALHRPTGSEVFFEPDPNEKEIRRPVPTLPVFGRPYGSGGYRIEPEILQFIIIVASLLGLSIGLAVLMVKRSRKNPPAA